MRTGVSIIARAGSTRLKTKHFLEVRDLPILTYTVQRIAEEFKKEIQEGSLQIQIISTTDPKDQEFDTLYGGICRVFHGSEENIPLRHYQAAKEYGLDQVISVDGDDILCAVSGMRAVFDALNGGASYVRTEQLPFGMNSCGFKTAFLAQCLEKHAADQKFENGWTRVFDDSQLKILQLQFPEAQDIDANWLRLTLDYNDDFNFFKTVIENFGDEISTVEDRKIIRKIIAKKYYLINKDLADTYWANYNSKKAEEISQSKQRGLHE